MWLKNNRSIEYNESMIICDLVLPSVMLEPPNVRKKNNGTIKYDKSTIRFDISIAQFDDRTVKCEKKN